MWVIGKKSMADIKFFIVLSVICHKSYAEVEDVLLKIIGGSSCSIEDYPYLGCLMHNNFPRCGATLVTYKHFITAAHCTKNVNPCSLKVRVGSTFSSYGGKVFQVVKITPHPEYNTTTKEHDISVIEVYGEVTSETAHPIGLDDYTVNYRPGVYAKIMGWGTVKEGDSTGSGTLKSTRVPIISRDVCQAAYDEIKRNITDNMLCAGDMKHGGRDTCQGDSGGPLVWNHVMIGVVSFGKGCGNKRFPGVYLKIRNYLRFIYYAIGIHIY